MMSDAKQKKIALVTGASRGIGAAIARGLAANGFYVIINAIHRVAEAEAVASQIRNAGGEAEVRMTDVSNVTAVATLFDAIIAQHGRLDVLVNSAGIIRDTLLAASDANDFDAVLNTNLLGVVNCCRQAARYMVAQRSGVIVNLSSVAAQRPGKGQSNYAASKGGVEAFTKALAVELAPRGIRVNAVAPGVIDTDMTADVRALAGDEINRRILLRRPGRADEVANVVRFLCSDDASYITAQVWNVDGGFKVE